MKTLTAKTALACLMTLVSTCALAQDDEKVIDLWQDNTDKSYVTYTTNLRTSATKPTSIYTARYTELNGSIKGKGILNLYCGGERTWQGVANGGSYPSWKDFNGELHIYPYTKKAGCGFYGLLLGHGGKTFNPEDISGSLEKTNSELTGGTVTLHEGATLATWTGVRAARIANLNTEEGSSILGPAKKGSSNGGYFVLGMAGADNVLAGTIAPTGNDLSTKVGIIKEGVGTMRITGNSNLITGAVRVLEGKVMLNNDAAAARSAKKQGSIGALGNSAVGAYVFMGASIGGTGHSASVIDLYGNLEPGDDGIGCFTISDYVGAKNVDLRLRPSSKLYFEVASADSHDRLDVSGNLNYWNIGQDFATSGKTPIIYIVPTGTDLQVGDKFTLITAKGKTAKDNVAWDFRIQYPKTLSWKVTETEENGQYSLVAEVTSLAYSGQGDVDLESGENTNEDYNPDYDPDLSGEKNYSTPLREYAEKLGKHIGVAAPCWSYSITNFSDPNTQIIGKQFNMVVSENGMKFENTEQSQNSFSYGLGDACVTLGTHYDCLIRGHVFAWHKQNGSWVTENDNKNTRGWTRAQLQAILKNHIEKVAAHFKGKVTEWDVVNECLSDDQSAIRSNPDAYDLRHSVWYDGIGEDFIDSAFVWAHRADPTLKLYLTDYGVEFKGIAKTEALYNLAKRLLDNNIPLHGVGLQCHLDAGSVDAFALAKTVESYKQLGLECIITELDLGCDGTEAGFAQQAKDYAAITKVWLTHDNCPSMVIWGLKDSDSWRGSSPLLYKVDCSAKPAYYAIHRELRKAIETTGMESPAIDNKIPAIESRDSYNLQGQKVGENYKGLVIQGGKKRVVK